ncbi:MAG: hypothetical protein AAB839_01825 [Patescibacteria group bacterium]
MIPGILLVLLGLGLFIGGGIKMDDSPGIDRNHLIVMLIGLVVLVIGGVMLYSNVFGN